MFLADTGGKIAGLLMRKKLKTFKAMLDPNAVGGTPFLGISAPVIKAHGASHALAMKNAIRQAMDFAESGMIQQIRTQVDVMKLPREGKVGADG